MLDAAEAAGASTPVDVVAAMMQGRFGAPAALMEGPAVAAAAAFMTPLTMMTQAQHFWRRARGLSLGWSEALLRCRTPQDVIDVNARFGEKALALGYGEMFRVVEASALMGRRAVAPMSLPLRDVD